MFAAWMSDHFCQPATNPWAAPGSWIVGRDLCSELAAKAGSLRDDLDRVAPRNPICLLSADESWGLVNSLALRVARGQEVAEEVLSGTLRTPDGSPTGMIRGPALTRVRQAFPELSPERIEKLAANVLRIWASRGWTSVVDSGGCRVHGLLGSWRQRGRLPIRMRTTILPDELDAAVIAGVRSGDGDDWLVRGELLVRLEGSGASTPEEALQLATRAVQAGVGLCFVAPHAAQVHDALNVVCAVSPRSPGLRHRIVGVREARASDLQRLEHVPVTMSYHVDVDGQVHESALQGLDQPSPVSLAPGSSGPAPLALITRCSQANEQVASWRELIGLNVRGEARAWARSHQVGMLKEGAWADFVVLDCDPMISDALPTVLATASGGRLQFQQPGWNQ